MTPTITQILVSEITGTALLLLVGCGVVATVVLEKSKGYGGGWLLINFGWGLAVFIGASVAWKSGAHLNPAVTLALAMTDKIPWSLVPVYWLAEMIGAFLGSVLCWLAFKKNFDEEPNPQDTLGIFATGPVIRSYGWNVVTEAIATFVLIYWILLSPGLVVSDPTNPASLQFGNAGLGYAAVSFVILGLGNSLGAPTGYALNPARDLGARIAYAVMPIKGKGCADWGYSWVPVVGPMLGAVVASMLYLATKWTLV